MKSTALQALPVRKIQFCRFRFAGSMVDVPMFFHIFLFFLFEGEETFPFPTDLPQNLTPGRFRRAESESEVNNLEILHTDLENKKTILNNLMFLFFLCLFCLRRGWTFSGVDAEKINKGWIFAGVREIYRVFLEILPL